MVSTVIEFDQDRRIAWQSHPRGFVARFVAGRIWRYELEPTGGGTLVRESWDISQDHQRALLRARRSPREDRRQHGEDPRADRGDRHRHLTPPGPRGSSRPVPALTPP